MPRKRRVQGHTPLSLWIENLIKTRGVTARTLAKICGVSESTLSAWRAGSIPSEATPQLKKLANHFDASLAEVLTGAKDEVSTSIAQQYDRSEFFSGLCEIKIVRLIPKGK